MLRRGEEQVVVREGVKLSPADSSPVSLGYRTGPVVTLVTGKSQQQQSETGEVAAGGVASRIVSDF